MADGKALGYVPSVYFLLSTKLFPKSERGLVRWEYYGQDQGPWLN
jgi:hypothetical protein